MIFELEHTKIIKFRYDGYLNRLINLYRITLILTLLWGINAFSKAQFNFQ